MKLGISKSHFRKKIIQNLKWENWNPIWSAEIDAISLASDKNHLIPNAKSKGIVWICMVFENIQQKLRTPVLWSFSIEKCQFCLKMTNYIAEK